MARTKKQHYVPQFLLRHFSESAARKPKVWTLDKGTKEVRLSSVRDVAHENYFYECDDDDGTRLELEDLMTVNDSTGARIIAKILNSNSLRITPEEHVDLAYFVACQMSRVPKIRKDLESFRELIIQKWGPHVCAEGDVKPVGEYGPEDDKLGSLRFLQDVPEFAKILMSKVWMLSEAPRGCAFIIGDNPVTRHNMVDRSPRGNLGLENEAIEVYMPLSPRLSFQIICPLLAGATCLTPDLASEYMAAMGNGSPVKLKPENVEFANSLQVIWAERFVFGRKQTDLDMPLDMLRTNPELMDGPGVRQRPEDV
jgi:hypothetical protein